MFAFSTIRLRTKAACFEIEVRENRRACTTDHARRVHDALLVKLKEMAAGLDEIMKYEMRLIEAHRLGQDVEFDLDFVKFFFGLNWFGVPIPIMDAAEPVSSDELEGLKEIIERIEREICVIFTIA
ncbi:MAG: hypothetical protein EKK31_05280 [Hyphomicrobiales bacterium]|jgi:hypothetical protein|nr:MAG: hypothetical protein EKK31_05280 [Hyphomicrobiales bacterium]